LENLEAHLPTGAQLARLRALGVTFEEAGLTKERAAGLIDARKDELKSAPPKLEYLRVEHANLGSGAGAFVPITLLAKSSSGNNPYKVEFVVDGQDLRVLCHCPAGLSEKVCKHVLALATANSEMLFGSDQNALFDKVKSWPQYRALKQRTEAFIAELNQIEEAMANGDSQFIEWYSGKQSEHRQPDEEPSLIQVLTPGFDDDPEVRRKLREVEEAKAELNEKARKLKQEFLRGLRLGFHGI
jgi:hypothetical protein